MKPGAVILPDTANVPGNLAVPLTERQFFRQLYFFHELPECFAGVHPGNGLVMDISGRVPHSEQIPRSEDQNGWAVSIPAPG